MVAYFSDYTMDSVKAYLSEEEQFSGIFVNAEILESEEKRFLEHALVIKEYLNGYVEINDGEKICDS
jgi:hypothetical protein